MARERKRRPARQRANNTKNLNIPAKATWILTLILIAMSIIVARIWFLSVIQYDQRLEEARKPQKRVVVKPANRGTIRDRFNLPLAVNKVQYQASVLYSQLRQIPAVTWETDSEGKRVRRFNRREYVRQLSELLGGELLLDAGRIEDMIYSKAALYYNIPYVIKEEISEQEYYRLRMLEKDWLGLQARCIPKRHYPMNKVAADIIGYMGSINKQEYERVIGEINRLEEFLLLTEEGGNPEPPEGIEGCEEAVGRLKELRDKAYSINDYVGKSGIEGIFEQQLRGFQGKQYYYSDARGNFLRPLPGSQDPISGQRFLLTISSELQEFAEELLIKNERTRQARVSNIRKGVTPQEPWIKGGAIVAMDPNNGDILAMASYPRFDPNDFIPSGDTAVDREKRANVLRWFETESYIAAVWDQKRPLLRERFDLRDGIVEERVTLSWDQYLAMALTTESPLCAAIEQVGNVEQAIALQKAVEGLVALSEEDNLYSIFNALYHEEIGHKPHGGRLGIAAQKKMAMSAARHQKEISRYKAVIDKYVGMLSSNDDKVLLVDLCRLVVPSHLFSSSLLAATGEQPLADYRDASAAMQTIIETVRTMMKGLFRIHVFAPWCEENQKEFLKEKRELEKSERRYARPYLDYFDEEEEKMFESFWRLHRWQLLTAFLIGEWIDYHPDEQLEPFLGHLLAWQEEIDLGAHHKLSWWEPYQKLKWALGGLGLDASVEYLQTLRGYDDLDRPLYGKYRQIHRGVHFQQEKQLAAAFYPKYGYGYARSLAYRHAAAQGSIFKLVTAYQGLVEKYCSLDNPESATFEQINPIVIEDRFFKEGQEQFLGCHSNGKAIPRYYRGGRLPRSLSSNIGMVNIISALERSSNPYFALIAGDCLEDPENLAHAARLFSLGAQTGVALSAEACGHVPDDLNENRTGLYAMAIGQHTLVATPLQTAVMLSAIANGGKVFEPRIVNLSAGATADASSPFSLTSFRYQDPATPLEKAASGRAVKVTLFPTVVLRELFMPEKVRQVLIEGMYRVVERSYQFALGSLQQRYRDYPEAIRDFLSFRGKVAAKTSTAESVESLGLDRERGTNTYNHLWYGGIFFDDGGEKQKQSFLFKDKFGNPEIVVVVYLRYGAYGKDTAPIAAQMARKWKEIKMRIRP